MISFSLQSLLLHLKRRLKQQLLLALLSQQLLSVHSVKVCILLDNMMYRTRKFHDLQFDCNDLKYE
jgi:hypothetical protein